MKHSNLSRGYCQCHPQHFANSLDVCRIVVFMHYMGRLECFAGQWKHSDYCNEADSLLRMEHAGSACTGNPGESCRCNLLLS